MLSEAKHLSEKEVAEFRRLLRRWFRKNGRDLPWRNTRDPYAIFVSEVMLQQTQVATVIPYYERWLQRFPDMEKLACASESEVLHAWQGLGYYSRARNLHAAAKLLRDRYHGSFPQRIDELEQLPGAGPYTANAIATFAFDRSVPIVEANITRVLSRVFNLQLLVDENPGRKALWEMAAALVPKSGARIHNSALIDLGATVCGGVPKCPVCPVRKFCRAKNPSILPLKKMRPRERRSGEFHSFRCARGRVQLEQAHKRWRGLWILPTLETRPVGKSPIHVSQFSFTHHRITLMVFTASPVANAAQRWFRICDLQTIPIPSPHRRALNHLLSQS